MTPELPSLAGYPASDADEVVDPEGGLLESAAALTVLLGRDDIAALAAAAAPAFSASGGEIGVRLDGRPVVREVPLDPVPRVLGPTDWAALASGVAQRHRALDAFLCDVYRAGGRRRSDPDRAPEVVRAGVLPEWAVVRSPVRDPGAVGMAWPDQRRIALLGCDVVRASDGRWLVRADDARVPGGLGLALAARRGVAAGAPDLLPPEQVPDPADAVPLLRAALHAAAPRAVVGPPSLAVVRSGDRRAAAGEDAVLAEALDVPLVAPTDLWPRVDGGVAAVVDGRRLPIDVLHLRLDDAELAAQRTPAGQTVAVLLGEAVRSGRLGLANVPGNAVADDLAMFAAVPAMIRFYLDEEPLLDQLPTWALADDEQWASVRDRLHELVVVPVAAYGGGRTRVGPECSAAELAELQAEVAAAPHRFIARALVPPSTAPTLVGDRLAPRAVDLRIFSVAIGDRITALDAPLTRVASGHDAAGLDLASGAGVKDTWLLPG